jgi:hypothetical protein
MRTSNFGWLITAVIILGVIWIWIITIQDGRRIISRGERQDHEPVPYYSKEHGEDEDTNP